MGTGREPIPVHFSCARATTSKDIDERERRLLMRDLFDCPDLGGMDDGIANGTFEPGPGEARAARIVHRVPRRLLAAPDAPLHRHHAGAIPELVLFTNYQFYIDEFRAPWARMMAGRDQRAMGPAFVDPERDHPSCGRCVRARPRARRSAVAPAADAGLHWCAAIAPASRWSISASVLPTPRR